MSHKAIFFTFFLFFVTSLVATAQNQSTPPVKTDDRWQLVALSSSPPPRTFNTAADSCAAAPTLSIPGGDNSAVNNLTGEISDPVLACMWGSPSNNQGYRTAWYKFVAPNNGQVIIDTFGSNYDTVLAVYAGSCGSLVSLVCSDDAQGLSSKVALTVVKGATYYVEVADWQFSPPNPANLSITAVLQPINSLWQPSSTLPQGLTRHATAVVGNNLYVIGGQTSLSPAVLSNDTYQLNTATGAWSQRADMPGNGYSNTSAAYLDSVGDNGRIYLPSGYSGNDLTFDMTHWVYDVPGNFWFTAASASTISGIIPFAWATAVATPSQGGYYVVGGLASQPPFTASSDAISQVLFYSINQNLWFVRTSLTTARYAHTAALLGNYICVVGGITDNNTLVPGGECTAIGSSSWGVIANLNQPRYNAASAVGPDGRWVVYGGTDAVGNTLSSMEVYDFDTDTWTLLDVPFDLGGSASEPARSWPRGGYTNNHFWAVGGDGSGQAFSLVNRLFAPPNRYFLPIVQKPTNPLLDDHFGVAIPLAIGVARFGNFDTLLDFYDAYSFSLSSPGPVTISLSQIPVGSDYNFRLYNANKLLWATADNPGNLSESETVTLFPGTYYILVERVFPFGDPNPAQYRLLVTQ